MTFEIHLNNTSYIHSFEPVFKHLTHINVLYMLIIHMQQTT